MLNPIFKKVQKHAFFKINYYAIKTIFLKCSSNILYDLFLVQGLLIHRLIVLNDELEF